MVCRLPCADDVFNSWICSQIETDEHISLLILERSDKAIRHVLAILMNEIRRICCRVIVNRHKSYVAAAAGDEKKLS